MTIHEVPWEWVGWSRCSMEVALGGLSLGLPCILRASVSAQLEQPERQCSPQRKSSPPVGSVQELECGGRFPCSGCEDPPHRPIWDLNIGKCHQVRKSLYLNRLLAVFGGLGSRTVFAPSMAMWGDADWQGGWRTGFLRMRHSRVFLIHKEPPAPW